MATTTATGLTPKQEAFAHAVASGKTQADAYRASFSATKMKATTIAQAASRLMADSNVSAMVERLRKPVADAAQVTLAGHLSRLSDLSDAAEKEGKYSAAVAAEIARGKAAGLYVERSEVTGKNGGPLTHATVTPEELAQAINNVREKF